MSINERVLAVLRTAESPMRIFDIEFFTGLPRVQVKNAVMRLKHSQQIRRVRRYPSEYVVRGA